MTAEYAEVIVPVPVEGPFHYLVPDHLRGRLERGHRVLVPFGRRRMTGFVAAIDHNAPEVDVKLRPISERLDDSPLLTDDLLSIIRFTSDYYLTPIGEVLRVALPPGLTAASVATFRATKLGRRQLEAEGALSPEEREALTKAARPRGLKKSELAQGLANRLLEAQWVSFRERFEAKEAQRTVEVVVKSPDASPEALGRSPKQREIYEAFGESAPVSELESKFERTALRRGLRALQAKGLIELERRPVSEDEPSSTRGLERPLELSPAQAGVLEQIIEPLQAGQHRAFLLRGVTGSGKTEVYLQAIARARQLGLGAIVLVPEIALTSQIAGRFTSRFGEDVVVLHSALSDPERRRGWQRLRSGQAHIALGPRSAVWAPVERPGVLVVDEEHDPSFKQNTELRYNGRDLALLRAHRAGGVAILGSATPSLESRQLAQSGRLTELRLSERISGRPLPEVQICDLSKEPRVSGEVPMFGRLLSDALRETIENKEQAILFLNRRGFNTVVVCEECTEARRCSDCSIGLTYHKSTGKLVCHYCGRQERVESPCPSCGSRAMRPFGVGTERIQEAVRDVAPEARVLRLDRDVTAKAGALEETLRRFKDHEVDVMVGTQMVAKGHDFPRVTLVGIVCADTSLAFPDFRASERTFQLLTQVAGRAGRAERPGRVIVQTFQPEHYALACAMKHDDDRFFEIESEIRERASYPPYARVGLIRLESDNLVQLDRTTQRLARIVRALDSSDEQLRVRGPTPSPIERVRNRWRRMVMLMAPSPAKLVASMSHVKQTLGKHPSSVHVIYDVDALDML